MPVCKMYRFDSQGFFEAEDVTYSDKDVDFVRDFRAPAMHTWTPPPKYDPATEIPQWVGDKWRIVVLSSLKPTLEELKAQKLAELAATRWSAEAGGLTLPDGTVIKTDRESQALLTGAALKAMQDPEYSCWWKSGDDWVRLDASAILAIADAVRTHVQACFDRERQLYAMVEAAQTASEVQSISW